MNIGIYIDKIHIEEGGGYTFQQTILEALSSLKINDSFKFFLLHYGDQPALFNLESISLKPSFNFRFNSKIKKLIGKKNIKSFLNIVLQENEIDIVWFPTYHFQPVDLPYLFTVWDLQHRLQPFFPEVSMGGEWERRELLFSKALHKASYILTGTDRGMDEISLLYQIPKERMRKLPHPTPKLFDIIPISIDHLIQPDLSGKYILYPAQFWPHKNHIRILESLSLLKKETGITISAVFVGADKSTASYLKDMTKKLGVDQQIHFLGFLTKQELVSLYKKAFSVVYPSLFGPENLPPLEAFSVGCPAIVSNIPGANEQYGDAALYFDPLDSHDLAKQIYKLWNDASLRKSLIDKGYNRATLYTPQNYIEDILKILGEFRSIRMTWSNS